MSPPPPHPEGSDDASALSSFRRTSTTEDVERVLREAIIAGEFRQGEQIREVATATRLGIGRGPIREALRHLEQEGLVTYEVHRGTFVKVVTRTDVLDIYTARLAIETEVAHLLIQMPDDTDLSELWALVNVMREADGGQDAPSTRLVEADIALHEALVRLAGSARLTRMFSALSAEMQMYLLHNHPPYSRELYVEDHEALVRAITERRPDAPDVMRHHLQHARDVVMTAMRDADSPVVHVDSGEP